LTQGIVKALMAVWGVGCASAGVAGIACLSMKTYSLDRDAKEEEEQAEMKTEERYNEK
jgi:hypothetical protein